MGDIVQLSNACDKPLAVTDPSQSSTSRRSLSGTNPWRVHMQFLHADDQLCFCERLQIANLQKCSKVMSEKPSNIPAKRLSRISGPSKCLR